MHQKTDAHYPIGEQRVVFRNLSWDKYLAVLAAVGNNRSARLTYDRGTLEITKPLESHEFVGEMMAQFVYVLVEELRLKIKSMGSTTLNYPQLERGAEPDKGFYIQNQPLVAGRIVDLEKDPPPDLVLEVDISYTDINKPGLYAAMGVPEFWRFDGEELRILILQGEVYEEEAMSPTFPQITKGMFYQFLAESAESEMGAIRNLRQRLQELS